MIVAGDIGGTKTLLAAFDGSRCVFKKRYGSHEFRRFADLLSRFFADAQQMLGEQRQFRAACFGIAGPVIEQRVKVTNLPWEIDAQALSGQFPLPHVHLLNDFAAAAHGLDVLTDDDLATLQPGLPLPQRPRVIVGAGTGLGAAYLLGQNVLSGEGGHVSFAPANDEQAALWHWLHERFGRVEVEHVVCGRGQALIYEFLLERQADSSLAEAREVLRTEDPAPLITTLALEKKEPLALAAVDLFIDCYGAVAGDHALAVLARGGVFVAGGIAPKLLPRLREGRFVAAFNDKGKFAEANRACPVHVVVNPELPLLGAAAYATRLLTHV